MVRQYWLVEAQNLAVRLPGMGLRTEYMNQLSNSYVVNSKSVKDRKRSLENV